MALPLIPWARWSLRWSQSCKLVRVRVRVIGSRCMVAEGQAAQARVRVGKRLLIDRKVGEALSSREHGPSQRHT